MLEMLLNVVLMQSRAENILDSKKQNGMDSVLQETSLRISNTARSISELSHISTYESVKNLDGAVHIITHIKNSTYYKCSQFGDDKAGETKNKT